MLLCNLPTKNVSVTCPKYLEEAHLHFLSRRVVLRGGRYRKDLSLFPKNTNIHSFPDQIPFPHFLNQKHKGIKAWHPLAERLGHPLPRRHMYLNLSAIPDSSTSALQWYLPVLHSLPACWQSGSASSSCWLQWEPNSHLLGLHKPGDLPRLKGDEMRSQVT